MDPTRKRTVRLVVALTAALVLAGLLAYTSFSAGSPEKIPSQLASAKQGETYKLGGKVAKGTLVKNGDVRTFRVIDPKGSNSASVPVRYEGTVPDPFREGREISVTVTRSADGTFVGEQGTLITKCPSKFTKDQAS
jgi:cytochrome c-type biogenesis protein CcmE